MRFIKGKTLIYITYDELLHVILNLITSENLVSESPEVSFWPNDRYNAPRQLAKPIKLKYTVHGWLILHIINHQ